MSTAVAKLFMSGRSQAASHVREFQRVPGLALGNWV